MARYPTAPERIYLGNEHDEHDELVARLRELVAEWRSADVHLDHRSGTRIAADQLEAVLDEPR